MGVSIRLEFDRPDRTYRTGELVRGWVRVSAKGGARCRGLRLSHSWETDGKGNLDRGHPPTVIPLPEGPLPNKPVFALPFEFLAPKKPLTYHGRALEVHHYVDVEAEIPGDRDVRGTEDFIVAPGPLLGPPPTSSKNNPVSRSEILLHPNRSPSLSQIGRWALGPFLRRQAAELMLGSVRTRVNTRVAVPGDSLNVEIRIAPKSPVKLNGASMELRAQEVCVSGTGSNRKINRYRVFSKVTPISLPRSLGPGSLTTFTASALIPDKGIYSFALGENALAWEAVVRVDIPLWPDWEKRFPLLIWPVEGVRGVPEAKAVGPVQVEGPVQAEEPGALEEPEIPSELVEPDVLEEPEIPSELVEPDVLEEPEIPSELVEPDVLEEPESTAPPLTDPSPALAEAVRAIREEEIFGGNRNRLIKALLGVRFTFSLTVDRVDRTFGLYSDAAYRNGRTVTGTIPETGVEVRVWFPEEQNVEIDAVELGAVLPVSGPVADFDRLSLRPAIRVDVRSEESPGQG